MKRAIAFILVIVACCVAAQAVNRPDDFDSFWDAKLKELAATPPNPQLESADSTKPGVEYCKITLDNIRGSKIRGQLARPRGSGKLPAILIVQWAGVYPLQKDWIIWRAAEGWFVLNINAHDLPIDEPESYYKQQQEGPLKDYWSIGNDDPETSYFLRMYLSCHRAADYLAQRDDWDGKTLVVTGGSQGGMQALVTAALHSKITAALALVPAGCDMKIGWPHWHGRTEGKDADKVRRASEYFDVVNFAPRIKCPILVGVGMKDPVCPPEGILAAMSKVTAPREVIELKDADHDDKNGSHGPYKKRLEVWLAALRQGKPAPVPR